MLLKASNKVLGTEEILKNASYLHSIASVHSYAQGLICLLKQAMNKKKTT